MEVRALKRKEKQRLEQIVREEGHTNLNNFWTHLSNERDRGTALIAGAYLDTQLEYMLRDFLVEDKKEVEQLFEVAGPLATFSAKIRMAYTLALIAPYEFQDLTTIRNIRNRFAHSLEPLTFDDQDVGAECKKLQMHFVVKDPIEEEKPKTNRTLFIEATVIASIRFSRVLKAEEEAPRRKWTGETNPVMEIEYA